MLGTSKCITVEINTSVIKEMSGNLFNDNSCARSAMCTQRIHKYEYSNGIKDLNEMSV